jgi:hypothetical protein
MNGTYEGTRQLQVRPGTDPAVAKQLATVRVVAKEDGAATLEDGGVAAEGNLDPGMDGVTFLPQRIAGVSVDFQPPELVRRFTIKLTPQKDGSWLYPGGVVLLRVAE